MVAIRRANRPLARGRLGFGGHGGMSGSGPDAPCPAGCLVGHAKAPVAERPLRQCPALKLDKLAILFLYIDFCYK